MRFAPVKPASIRFADDGTPRSDDYGDVYHARHGALEQAQAVFLAGNGLPGRWQGVDRFVVLETGFGLGHNFLATWRAWRRDPARCARLFFVSMDRHPVARDALAMAYARHAADPELQGLCAAMLEAWPEPSPDLHHLSLDDGRVTLLLAHADVEVALRQFRLRADAIYLDGFSPRLNPQMWTPTVFKALARLCKPGTTLATWSAAGDVQRHLRSAGFDTHTVPGWAGKREQVRAQRLAWPTRPGPARTPTTHPWQAGQAPVVVVGAGLAGAACAQALSQSGVPCVVLERAAEVATGASGNPAGLFHGVLHREDGAHARLSRAAACMAAREYARRLHLSSEGQVQGLERRESQLDAPAMQALIEKLGLPPGYVRALSPDTHWDAARWLYPTGGWIDPRAWVRRALRMPGVEVRTQAAVHCIERVGRAWVLRDTEGQELARSGHVVLCHAAAVLDTLPKSVTQGWPVGQQRGQITRVPAGTPGLRPMDRPRSGGGYALTLPDGDVWCGASASVGDFDPTERQTDHADNLRKLEALTGQSVSVDPAALQGRVAWRFHTDDRLPMVGPCPAFSNSPGEPATDAASLRLRDWPSEPGLFMATALGSRGITWAPLIGAVIAAQVRGDPMPLPGDLLDAMDPRRFALRRLRRGR